MSWKTGDEVYCRSRDFFGFCAADEDEDGTIMVKWSWPVDPDREPEKIAADRLQDAEEVRRRYQ